MTKNEITTKWRQFYDQPLPELEDEEIKGISLYSIDTFSAGCISSYAGGNLDQDCIEVLKNCKKELDMVLPYLEDNAKEYFSLLKELIENIFEIKKIK